MQTYRGRWMVTVVGKDSAWAQRVVVAGASVGGGATPGVVGTSVVVDGAVWTLTVEHNDGTHGWQPNASVVADPLIETGAELSQIVRSKDAFHPGDTDPNDLVLRVDKLGPMFELPVRPYAVDGESLLMFADGIFVGVNGVQLMGVDVTNTWGETFTDELLFDVSDLGRATLASFGIVVLDAWTPTLLVATQQSVSGRAVVLPRLRVGERATVYFLVDASGARRGKPDVEFVLHDTTGDPDPLNSKRYRSRTIFIAEVEYDRDTGAVIAQLPEGRLTLTLQSLAVDPVALQRLCRRVLAPGRGRGGGRIADDIVRLARQGGGKCDQKTLRALIALLCRCLSDDCKDCDDHGGSGGGWQRVCLPGGIWLPLRFEYGVEITGGFVGQHGPLAFQDPWWKVVLLVIALLAWLVGLIVTLVADHTGWGNTGDHPRTIGTVGASNRTTTDAALIELDDSRPFLQKTLDAVTGETNATPILGFDTVIPVDPQVAFPTLTSAAVVGKRVYKSGSRTGLTHGIISSLGPSTQNRGSEDGTPDPNHPNLSLPNQFAIGTDPAIPEELFDDHGDSGSIVLSREPDTMNQVVGLLHSLNGRTSPIQDVMSALGVKLR